MLIYYYCNSLSIQIDTLQHFKQLNSENKLALTILVFIAVRLSLHMISANASPQEKNLNMGLLSIHPACYPLAVQRQLGMLKPRTSKQNIIWDPRITAEHKSLRSSREDMAVCGQKAVCGAGAGRHSLLLPTTIC